jgi:hypothetical protein
MQKRLILILSAVAMTAGYAKAQPQEYSDAKFHKAFFEDFSGKDSRFFDVRGRRAGEGEEFRLHSGVPSFSEKETNIILYRIDPKDPAGAGRGPEIISKELTYYGTYTARLKVPDIRKVQPKTGAVVGYVTYHVSDNEGGLSEIDFEWLIADPTIIYIGTWTGQRPLNRVGRIVNMATGEILDTSYKRQGEGGTPFTDPKQLAPQVIQAIPDYDASARFYTYGFDWYPDRLTWWMEHPETGEKITLWDYTGTTPNFTGIPNNPTHYRLNFWHTDNWPVETNRNSIEAPLYNYELEVDWMSYTPFDGQ